jgi:hypothetical protein
MDWGFPIHSDDQDGVPCSVANTQDVPGGKGSYNVLPKPSGIRIKNTCIV